MIQFRDWVEVVDAEDLEEDSHGNVSFDWENAPPVREPGKVKPLSDSTSVEDLIGQDTVITRWKVTLLPMTSATAKSRVLWRGDTYEVEGDVQLHTDIRDRPHHCTAILKRISG